MSTSARCTRSIERAKAMRAAKKRACANGRHHDVVAFLVAALTGGERGVCPDCGKPLWKKVKTMRAKEKRERP